MPNQREHAHDEHGCFAAGQRDPLIRFLHTIIQCAVRALAVLMVLVILWGIGEFILVLYQKLTEPPVMLLNIGDILQTLGTSLAVLIAIEIFINITVYLREDVIHGKLVIATGVVLFTLFEFEKRLRLRWTPAD